MIHRPSHLHVLQAKEEMNVEDVGVGFHRAEDFATIAFVALHDVGVEVRRLGLGGLHEGNGLLHHRRVLEVAKHAAKLFVQIVVFGRIVGIQLIADGPNLGCIRFPAPAHCD